MPDDANPERLARTHEVREQLEQLERFEQSLPDEHRDKISEIKRNIREYLDWNEVDAQAVRQNMALRNDETGERR